VGNPNQGGTHPQAGRQNIACGCLNYWQLVNHRPFHAQQLQIRHFALPGN